MNSPEIDALVRSAAGLDPTGLDAIIAATCARRDEASAERDALRAEGLNVALIRLAELRNERGAFAAAVDEFSAFGVK